MKNSFLTKIQKVNKPCIHPWFYLWINAAADVTVCPQNRTRLGSLNDLSISEIWNTVKLQQLRKNFLEGNYEEAGCEKECPYLRGSYTHAKKEIQKEELIFPDIDLDLIKNQNHQVFKNLTQAKSEYEEKITHLKSTPSVFDCQSILTCNADCIMCGQPHNSKLKHSNIVKEKISNYTPNLATVRWQGGEVFLDKDFLDFQEKVSLSNPSLNKVIITNGTMISNEDIDQLLSQNGNLKFIVSMDGKTKQTVNKIRYKLKYEKILSTIEYLALKQKELNKSDILLWNYTVMLSNIEEVSLAITFAQELNISINFAAIQGKHPLENFFEYNLISHNEWNEYNNLWERSIKKTSIKISGIEGLKERFKLKN